MWQRFNNKNKNRYYDEDNMEAEYAQKTKLKYFFTNLPVLGALIILLAAGWYGFNYFFNNYQKDQIPVIYPDEGPIKIKPSELGGINIPDQDKNIYENLSSSTLTEENSAEVNIVKKPDEPIPVEQMPFVEEEEDTATPPPSVKVDKDDITSKTEIPKNAVIEPKKELLNEPTNPSNEIDQSTTTINKEKTLSLEDKMNEISEKFILPKSQEIPVPKKVDPKSAAMEKIKFRDKKSELNNKRTYRIQIGIFPSKDVASNEWINLSKRLPHLLGKFSPHYEYTTLQGKAMHRLMVGNFEDENSAKKFCKMLRDARVSCWIAKPTAPIENN